MVLSPIRRRKHYANHPAAGNTPYNYNVIGISREKVEAIAYRMLTVYLTQLSNFEDARSASLAAASDLYGPTDICQILKQINEAWRAVGVTTDSDCLNICLLKNNTHCAGYNTGSATINVSGGSNGAYLFKWSNPTFSGHYAVNMPAGVYEVTVTDQLSCSAHVGPFTIQGPLNIELANASPCFTTDKKFTATAHVSEGTYPYNFLWNTTPVQLTQAASNLPQGMYAVTVSDAKGCTASAEISLSEGPEIKVDAGMDSYLCNADFVNLNSTSSLSNVTYEWNPFTGLNNGKIANPIASPIVTTTYTLTVKDNNTGCSKRMT